MRLPIRPFAPLVACLLLAAGAALCRADDGAEAPFQPTAWQRPEERAKLYRVLEQHGKVLESQSAVLKAVARLIGPAVVHIEAE
ncbi:MAG: hypothetical protein U1E05_23955, partial [Patescibacteria group bacterium]|nr:hypothetical protein [Patescibacteria group bacterium]